MFEKYRRNWQILKREVYVEGTRFEGKPYEELLRPAEELSTRRFVDGVELFFSAEAYKVMANGDICFCIDADGLPTLFGMKPSYQFKKRRDSTVYY